MMSVLFKAFDVVLKVTGAISLTTLFLTIKNGGTLEIKSVPKEEKEGKD